MRFFYFSRSCIGKAFLLIVVLILGTKGFCQPGKINFENFTIEKGLSNDLVHNVIQDKRGWMWFGTYHGLNRFDGYKFTIFDIHESQQSTGGTVIRALFEDKEERLWIGTDKNGVYIFNKDKENFKKLSGKYHEYDLNEQAVNAITKDRNGFIWLGTNNGLCKVDLSGKILKLYQYQRNNENHSISSNSISFRQEFGMSATEYVSRNSQNPE